MTILTIIAIFFICCGMFFFTGGAVGIIRMPDFYTRLHPAGKLDSLGILCCVLGLALYNLGDFSWANIVTSLKMTLVIVFIYIGSPTATHAMADCGFRAGLKFWQKKK